MTTPGEIKEQKSKMRMTARLSRKNLKKNFGPFIDNKITESFCRHFLIGPDKTVAGYFPIGSEADVKPLLTELYRLGCTCLLPIVVAVDEKLEFREWRPHDRLILSDLGIFEPACYRPVGTPNMLLVPLLAYDMRGYRLGYGGGYYDRTLIALRAEAGKINQKLEAIGIGYSGQRVEHVPHDEFDQRIDWVINENGLYRF